MAQVLFTSTFFACIYIVGWLKHYGSSTMTQALWLKHYVMGGSSIMAQALFTSTFFTCIYIVGGSSITAQALWLKHYGSSIMSWVAQALWLKHYLLVKTPI